MVADHRDGQGGRFVHWRALGAVALAARDDPDLTDADVRLLLEVASWTDLDTGWCRRTLRQLAAGVHHGHHGAVARRLARLVGLGYLERRGTGRAGYPSPGTTEQYRIRGAAPSPLRLDRGAATAPHEVPPRHQAEVPPRHQLETERELDGVASPAPSRSAGSATPERIDVAAMLRSEGREDLALQLEASKARRRREAERLRSANGPPPLSERGTGTWG